MAKKKTPLQSDETAPEAAARPQLITDTIITNYMPYVMSVIVSRAIPEIDGFKPSHRKLLYTMYEMGLLTKERTKSANVVGQTMRLNPHGDMAIYETLVRLTRGYDALLHPFIDSKGSFGKHYSSDMAFSASRYTEVKLDKFCNEIFRGIDKNAVDFVPNYDNTMQEPVLLPTSFPNILVSANSGIAVSMASKICSFNLAEVCDGAVLLLKRPYAEAEALLDVIKAPDFTCGGEIIYEREKLLDIYRTGKGSFKIRAKYKYDAENNCIDIIEIPYSTSIEIILKSISDLVKNGTIKDISDFRDEIDLKGFKLTLDLKRGTDPDILMRKLYKLTSLEDSFECNFNVLIDGAPKLLGVRDILVEWIKFRMECFRRETKFELSKVEEKLHLLYGLAKILLDIDLAIKIVRETENEKDVVPNLMRGFDIDEVQANYVADIRLRSLNNEYILNRTAEISELESEAERLRELHGSDELIKKQIIAQLNEIKKKYGKPRKTTYREKALIEAEDNALLKNQTEEKFDGRIFYTEKGYFKKIKNTSLRMSDKQNLRDGDRILWEKECLSGERMMFFTDAGQAYNADSSMFDAVKASDVGQYVPAVLGFDAEEKAIGAVVFSDDYSGNVVFIFRNGKGVRIPLESYRVKGNRKKLVNAVSVVSPCIYIGYELEPYDVMLISENGRALTLNTSDIPLMSTRNAAGNSLMTLKAKNYVSEVITDFSGQYSNPGKYRKNLPSSGVLLRTDK